MMATAVEAADSPRRARSDGASMPKHVMPWDRPKLTGLLHAQALCVDCGWEVTSRNSVALAARHSDSTGHQVQCEQVMGITFRPKEW